MLFGPRVGDMNAGIVVQRVLGLRNIAELAPAAPPAGAPAWYGQRWMDADGGAWQEIDLASSRGIRHFCRWAFDSPVPRSDKATGAFACARGGIMALK